MIVDNYDADLEVSDTCVHSSLLSMMWGQCTEHWAPWADRKSYQSVPKTEWAGAAGQNPLLSQCCLNAWSQLWDTYVDRSQCSRKRVQQLKKRKKSCFFEIWKKCKKNVGLPPTYSFTGRSVTQFSTFRSLLTALLFTARCYACAV